MKQSKLHKTVVHNGVTEYDFLDNTITGMEINFEPSYYQISETDSMRPDMISYQMYGTVDYWWIILASNGIVDPFTELTIGRVLLIPNINDIYSFIKNKRKS